MWMTRTVRHSSMRLPQYGIGICICLLLLLPLSARRAFHSHSLCIPSLFPSLFLRPSVCKHFHSFVITQHIPLWSASFMAYATATGRVKCFEELNCFCFSFFFLLYWVTILIAGLGGSDCNNNNKSTMEIDIGGVVIQCGECLLLSALRYVYLIIN